MHNWFNVFSPFKGNRYIQCIFKGATPSKLCLPLVWMGVYFKRNHFSFLLEAIPFEKGFDVQESKDESQKLSPLIFQVYQVPQKKKKKKKKKRKKERRESQTSDSSKISRNLLLPDTSTSKRYRWKHKNKERRESQTSDSSKISGKFATTS